MTNKNLISPNKKHEISFGEMWEQSMGGAYYCPIFLNYTVTPNRDEAEGIKGGTPMLLHERNTGNAVWKDNNTVFFPIWMRTAEGHLMQQLAFYNIKKKELSIFEKLYNFVEIKAIKGNELSAIDSPHWQPKGIVIDVKTEKKGKTISWSKIDSEIAQMKHRLLQTSVAPWVSFIEGRDCESGSSFIMTGIPKGENIWGETRGEDIYITGATDDDKDFIAHARQDIPMLIGEIERLKALIKLPKSVKK
jgi:hypothetical protein